MLKNNRNKPDESKLNPYFGKHEAELLEIERRIELLLINYMKPNEKLQNSTVN